MTTPLSDIAIHFIESGLSIIPTNADKTPGRINLDHWENELYLIQTGELDYAEIISGHMRRLEARMQKVEVYLEEYDGVANES